MSKSDKQKIARDLISFGKRTQDNIKKEKYFTPNLKADKLIWNNPLAYLFAVILDQSMKAERVWEIPFLLKQRLGYFDVNKIANTDDRIIIEAFNKKPKLHRFPKTMALRMKKACQLLLNKYDGKAEYIWNDNPRSGDLQRRFQEFNGIGQKKASMATNILARDFGIKFRDKKGIDISYDIHVRRVFLRTALVDKDDMYLMIETARKLNPPYPGALDNPSWLIGRKYCSPNKPKCDHCPISDSCPRLINNDTPKSL